MSFYFKKFSNVDDSPNKQVKSSFCYFFWHWKILAPSNRHNIYGLHLAFQCLMQWIKMDDEMILGCVMVEPSVKVFFLAQTLEALRLNTEIDAIDK